MAYEVQEGEAFVDGLTQENAKALLEAAEALDIHPHEVRTVSNGFVVPEAVADKAFPPKKQSAAQKKAAEKDEETA
jgi:hypothetical protein